jgi:hypothetical protein
MVSKRQDGLPDPAKDAHGHDDFPPRNPGAVRLGLMAESRLYKIAHLAKKSPKKRFNSLVNKRSGLFLKQCV